MTAVHCVRVRRLSRCRSTLETLCGSLSIITAFFSFFVYLPACVYLIPNPLRTVIGICGGGRVFLRSYHRTSVAKTKLTGQSPFRLLPINTPIDFTQDLGPICATLQQSSVKARWYTGRQTSQAWMAVSLRLLACSHACGVIHKYNLSLILEQGLSSTYQSLARVLSEAQFLQPI